MQKPHALSGALFTALAFSTCIFERPGFATDQPTFKMSIERIPFGKSADGQAVELYTLRNEHGLTAKVITYGAIIYSFEAPDRAGRFTNVTANCASLSAYENKSPCFGALIGRYANRIAGGKFMLDG